MYQIIIFKIFQRERIKFISLSNSDNSTDGGYTFEARSLTTNKCEAGAREK